MRKAAVLHLLGSGPIAAAAVLAAPALSRAATTTGVVQGTIRNAEGEPLSGVNVFLEGAGRTTVTGKNGFYLFTGVQPGSYTVRAELVTFALASAPVSVLQDQTSVTDFALEKEITQTEARVAVPTVQRVETTTQQSISVRTEQLTKSRPRDLYQFAGLVFGQPGIVTDLGGFQHIRGSDVNQIGYQVDGVTITEPVTNAFGTTLVTVGLKNANLYTGGVDAAYGGYLGGFINQVTQNGRDLRGGIVEYTGGPGHGHEYSGTNLQYGNLFGKYDLYGAFIGFKHHYPGDASFERRSNADGLLKLNYYLDPDSTVTAFHSQGFQESDFLQPFSSQTRKYDRSETTARLRNEFNQDQLLQGNALTYLSYKRNFGPRAFATYRLYRLYTFGTFHVENIGRQYQHRDSTQIGNQLDYSHQITPNYRLQAGLHRIGMDANREVVQGIAFDWTDPAAPAGGYIHRLNRVKPVQTVLYLDNQIKPLGDNRLTFDLGLRHSQMRFNLAKFPSFTNSYTDPRLGVTYSPNRDLVFRSSFYRYSQFPDVQLIEVLFPQDLGFATAKDPAAQQTNLQRRFRQYNRLEAQHAQGYDLGVEKGFDLLGGSFNATLTGYRRRQYNLAQNPRPFFMPPVEYNNDGTGHASGIEFKLEKRRRRASDLNGFVTYTNQVVRATSSLSDTIYGPYFQTFVFDPLLPAAQVQELNRREFATSYDQRHTVAVVANKRLSKRFETTLILDAGSGFPFTNGFFGGGASDGQFGGGADTQHGEKTLGTAADFTEVPIVLLDNQTIRPQNPVAGRSGWHYKISLNNNFYVNPNAWFFLNVDNVFNKRTVLQYAITNGAGAVNYSAPTAEYPQGRIQYGSRTETRPRFISFGIRTRF